MATQIFFIFPPNLGEMIQFHEHIFQMGWNHQLVMLVFGGCVVLIGWKSQFIDNLRWITTHCVTKYLDENTLVIASGS